MKAKELGELQKAAAIAGCWAAYPSPNMSNPSEITWFVIRGVEDHDTYFVDRAEAQERAHGLNGAPTVECPVCKSAPGKPCMNLTNTERPCPHTKRALLFLEVRSTALVSVRRRRGSNIIEFALTLPMFLFIISGVVDWSWFAYQRSILTAAAATGCRTASLVNPGPSMSDIATVQNVGEAAMQEAVQAMGGAMLCRTGGCNAIVTQEGLRPPGRRLVCRIDGVYQPLINLVPAAFNFDFANFPVHGTSTTLMEWQRWD